MKRFLYFAILPMIGFAPASNAQVTMVGGSIGGKIVINGKEYNPGECKGSLMIDDRGAFCDGKPLGQQSSKPPATVNPCAPEQAAPHAAGGGYVSATAKVDDQVSVPPTTSICGSVRVPKRVVIGANVRISGQGITLSEGVRVGANVQINGTGSIRGNTEVGANSSINGDFDLENTTIRANSDLRGKIRIQGVNIEGRMENCQLSGSASAPAKINQ